MGRQTVTTMGAGAKVDLAGLMKKLAAAHPYTGLSSDITISADASLVLGKTKLRANTVSPTDFDRSSFEQSFSTL
jgi:hypothetical protein